MLGEKKEKIVLFATKTILNPLNFFSSPASKRLPSPPRSAISLSEALLPGELDDLDAIGSSDRKRLDSLEQKVQQLTDAIIKIQDYLNKQPKRQNKSYNNTYNNRQAPRIQPLTEENLAKRLGVSEDSVREQRIKLPPPLFVAWCKGKDTSGIGWQFNAETLLYHLVT